jgi:hypothetical protein
MHTAVAEARSGVRRRKTYSMVHRRGEVGRIVEPSLNACVWRRSLPPELLSQWASHVSAQPGRVLRGEPTTDAGFVVRTFFGDSETRATERLARDASSIHEAFRKLVDGKPTVAQIEIVTSDKCKRFHCDFKQIRAVCTYVGPGTEWVDELDLNRASLAIHDHAGNFELQNARIVPDERTIKRATPGDVVFLKGESYPGNQGRGAVHRSPPIEQAGLKRLVLTLDRV